MIGVWFPNTKHNSAINKSESALISRRCNQSKNNNTKETPVQDTRFPTHLPDPIKDQSHNTVIVQNHFRVTCLATRSINIPNSRKPHNLYTRRLDATHVSVDPLSITIGN